MEKDIGEIEKNNETKIVLRIDDFGGSRGLTIREFVKSERYTGFTKAGVRIKADKFEDFKRMINSVEAKDLAGDIIPKESSEVDTEEAGVDDQGLM